MPQWRKNPICLQNKSRVSARLPTRALAELHQTKFIFIQNSLYALLASCNGTTCFGLSWSSARHLSKTHTPHLVNHFPFSWCSSSHPPSTFIPYHQPSRPAAAVEATIFPPSQKPVNLGNDVRPREFECISESLVISRCSRGHHYSSMEMRLSRPTL